MYGKIFDSMYDGTLADDWRALITFQQMIVLCDADGIIDMTPSAIARRTGIPVEHIKAGVEILENPDPYSRTPDDEGRRIQRMDESKPWGWYIVNHNKYKALQDADTVREQNRLRKQKQRKKQKTHSDSPGPSQVVTACHGPSRHTDTNTDTDIGNKYIGEEGDGDVDPPPQGALKTTITPDWQPSNDMKAVAKINGLPNPMDKTTILEFVSHHQSAGTISANWDALYTKWLSVKRGYNKAEKRNGKDGRNSCGSGKQNHHRNARDILKADIAKHTGSMADGVHGQDGQTVPREVDGEILEH